MTNLSFDADGRIPVDPQESGGFISPDKASAGLAADETLSTDPSIAVGQTITVIPPE